ncbi:predicted protein [Lichtheimia corymbifera JMRC:FSU:9682]|uniref:Uncharacterized protein n=1 Tax=Lichtheimia corymbifera JMRC:FSU:9682 TaxID=1263082 RepID=A0A068RM63_9FUNG|nr:predicted protein [Lichtheimia corymbifera JMRC:FSU:9682]
MDAIKCSDGGSRNVALATWRVVIRNDGSCCVDTAEDDDGLDGIDEWRFTATDDTGALDSMHAASLLQSWMKDDYDDNNQGYNDTIIPIVSM